MGEQILLQAWDSEYDDENDYYLQRYRNEEQGVELLFPETMMPNKPATLRIVIEQ